ncbi:DUF11 domain-containing protein [Blastopirellula sp. JC732]|uniref:DUF11 domain-containing protein n=1 Tax=Blastopirellula sediminis TaxID=2894196 RepID=A0A9X1SKN7_9BACT|nr:DUF11 domain-containing protein [Blastopirellula sediminis]MCC9606719.1 DUF11 domain-containing protein [Blastopirellula sediminis]MCC9629984.1 DUF11 domain-containing protein [Blastopirellula sediminis]
MKNLYLRFTAIGSVASLGVAAIVQSVLSTAHTAAEPLVDAAQENVAALVESSTSAATEEIGRYVPSIVRANNENDEPETKPATTPPPPASHRFSLGDSTPTPAAATPAPTTGSSRFLGDSGSSAAPTPAPVTIGDTPKPPVSRFSLGDSTPTPAAATPATSTPAPSTGSRFQLGDSTPTPSAAPATPAAVPTPAPSRFATTPAAETPAAAPMPSAMSAEPEAAAAAEATTPTPVPTVASNPRFSAPPIGGGSAEPTAPAPSSRFQFSSSGGESAPPISSTPAPVSSMPSTTPAATDRYPAPASIGGVVPVTPESYPAPRSTPSYGAMSDNQLGGAPAASGSGKPGDVKLEGLQQPSITLEKRAPAEIQVGKAATFSLIVKNVGAATAHDVVIRDSVPAGTALVNTTPVAESGVGGELLWKIGQIAPGEEKRLSMELMPQTEGDVGSVATVSFAAHATVRSRVTKPELTIEQTAAPTVLIGDNLLLAITVSNPGTGPATGVVLEEVVPANFTHPAGSELEFEIGTLKPGETRSLELVLKASKAGQTQNVLGIRGDGNLQTQTELNVEVIAPELQVSMVGPKLRYLDRPAKYQVSISNPGTAPAQNIDLITYLPKGMKFVDANNAGQYDANQHAIFWNLEELPPAQSGTVELTALPIEAGDQKIRVEGSARMGLAAQNETLVQVEGIVALFFEVVDQADPIELGKDTTYDVRVVNQGSKTATNVRVAAILPPGMQGVDASGAAKGLVSGSEVVFEPLARLLPKGEETFRIKVKGIAAGDQRIKVQVSSDEIPQPITKEESTRVYSDR